MKNDFDRIDKCLDYLKTQAGRNITFRELRSITSWSEENLRTNIQKRLSEFLTPTYKRGTNENDKTFQVNRKVLNVNKEDFRDSFRQKNLIFSSYDIHKYETVRIFDFYLPLTNENLLHQNLDELFFEDTLNRRLKSIETKELISIYEKLERETDDDYYKRLTEEASNLFWGYSISHVSGRYRTGSTILTKVQAAQKDGKAYLVDETTAVVKFIFPHETGKEEYHRKLDQLFKLLIVKAITESTPNEDEIWLLESIGKTTLNKYIKKI